MTSQAQFLDDPRLGLDERGQSGDLMGQLQVAAGDSIQEEM